MNPYESNEPKLSPYRLGSLAVLLLAILACYFGVLYDTQITNGARYLEQSVRTITRTEKVEASRGILTDRNGQVLVSNRQTYAMTFDASLLDEDEDANSAILRLIQLCRRQGVQWNDSLPISRAAPYSYRIDEADSTQRGRFLKYLQKTLEIVSTNVKSENFSNAVLTNIISPQDLMSAMRENAGIPESWSNADARSVLGVQYELAVRKLVNTSAYVFAENVSTDLISLLADGDYRGVKVSSSSVREYETSYAAHILGMVSRIFPEELASLTDQGYDGDDWIGRSGAEAAFEKYLRGTDGQRVVSTNADGKITGEYYSTQPQPGSTVALTLDMELQKSVEDTLEKNISRMNQQDGDETRGGAAVVIEVNSGEILALASYPTYDLTTYGENFATLNSDLSRPLFNRATNGTYAPGSTFKPLTAIAALQEGKVQLKERINDTGYWTYPDMIEGAAPWGVWCWNRRGHGRLNVTGAISNSCNYFFCEMGYRLGIDLLDQYAAAFGLGQKTGIEIGEKTGILAGPEARAAAGGVWYGGDTAQAAFGQSDHLFTPVQLANYTATLVNGGKHYAAHLLKSAKAYDNSAVVAVGDTEPMNVIEIDEANLLAVKEGMHDLVTTGSLAGYFRSCVVDAGAKTGTVQLTTQKTNNGVFICFAPYDEPEIAVAVVIERGGSGAALASTTVDILNTYFTQEESDAVVSGEQQLLY